MLNNLISRIISAKTFAFTVGNRKLFLVIVSPAACGLLIAVQDGHHPFVYGASFLELVTLQILYFPVIDSA